MAEIGGGCEQWPTVVMVVAGGSAVRPPKVTNHALSFMVTVTLLGYFVYVMANQLLKHFEWIYYIDQRKPYQAGDLVNLNRNRLIVKAIHLEYTSFVPEEKPNEIPLDLPNPIKTGMRMLSKGNKISKSNERSSSIVNIAESLPRHRKKTK
ncbi:hypothetical protein COLO4_20895 [Corchorus olitorius]|uniref:Uncharacterized protein n=1 Tax=Corchorus olitorius TaxID=93759 RepID=A0A1R3IWF4_9ROSI|nr:hypothetical protein COLO4_20895 [Corchorus olitorius]